MANITLVGIDNNGQLNKLDISDVVISNNASIDLGSGNLITSGNIIIDGQLNLDVNGTTNIKLTQLSDVTTTPNTGEFLKFDGSNWVTASISGGSGLTQSDIDYHRVHYVNNSDPTSSDPTSPNAGEKYLNNDSGDLFIYDGTNWNLIGNIITDKLSVLSLLEDTIYIPWNNGVDTLQSKIKLEELNNVNDDILNNGVLTYDVSNNTWNTKLIGEDFFYVETVVDGSSNLPSSPDEGDTYAHWNGSEGTFPIFIKRYQNGQWHEITHSSINHKLTLYSNDDNKIYLFNGTEYDVLDTTIELDKLKNVNITNLSSGDVLTYNGTEWVNTILTTDVNNYIVVRDLFVDNSGLPTNATNGDMYAYWNTTEGILPLTIVKYDGSNWQTIKVINDDDFIIHVINDNLSYLLLDGQVYLYIDDQIDNIKLYDHINDSNALTEKKLYLVNLDKIFAFDNAITLDSANDQIIISGNVYTKVQFSTYFRLEHINGTFELYHVLDGDTNNITYDAVNDVTIIICDAGTITNDVTYTDNTVLYFGIGLFEANNYDQYHGKLVYQRNSIQYFSYKSFLNQIRTVTFENLNKTYYWHKNNLVNYNEYVTKVKNYKISWIYPWASTYKMIMHNGKFYTVHNDVIENRFMIFQGYKTPNDEALFWNLYGIINGINVGYHHSEYFIDNHLYIGFGCSDYNNPTLNIDSTFLKLDYINDTYSILMSPSYSVSESSMTYDNDNNMLYLLGGNTQYTKDMIDIPTGSTQTNGKAQVYNWNVDGNWVVNGTINSEIYNRNIFEINMSVITEMSTNELEYVLTVGGIRQNGEYSDRVIAWRFADFIAYYDSETKSSSGIAPLPYPTINTTGVKVGGGNSGAPVYIFGGIQQQPTNQYLVTDKIYKALFQNTLNSWVELSSVTLPVPTHSMKAVGNWVDNVIYLIGGIDNNDNILDTIHIFDPSNESLTQNLTTIPNPVKDFAAFFVYNPDISKKEIWIIGGIDINGNYSSLIQIYDIDNDTWDTSTYSLSTARAKMLSVGAIYYDTGISNNKTLSLHVVGGETDSGITNTCEGFRFSSSGVNSATLNNMVYNTYYTGYSGYYPTNKTAINSNTDEPRFFTLIRVYQDDTYIGPCKYIQKYDINNNTWSLLDIELPVFLKGAIVEYYNNNLYIIGGRNEQGFETKIYKYDIVNNIMSELLEISFDIYKADVVKNNDKLYIIGGITTGDVKNTRIYIYDITNNLITDTSIDTVGGYGTTGVLDNDMIHIFNFENFFVDRPTRYDIINNTLNDYLYNRPGTIRYFYNIDFNDPYILTHIKDSYKQAVTILDHYNLSEKYVIFEAVSVDETQGAVTSIDAIIEMKDFNY